MDIAETYRRFQQEQVDAHDPNRRFTTDEFGHINDTPTVEGFDKWGPNGHVKPHVPTPNLDEVKARNAEARRRVNRLRKIRCGL